MTGKQIGDVLLSTANPQVSPRLGYIITVQYDNREEPYNIYYLDGVRRTEKQQKEDLASYYRIREKTPEEIEKYLKYPIHDFYNVPMEALIGQGVPDAGFTRGRHDKDWVCSVTVKRRW